MNEQAPGWFKPIAILALIWNIIGLSAFAISFMITPEVIAQLPPEEQALYNNIPMWATAAFALAVFAGVIGCILLLMKKAVAFELFVLSIIGVIVQNIHGLVLADTIAVHGTSAMAMPLTVFLIGVGLILMSKKAKQAGWIS